MTLRVDREGRINRPWLNQRYGDRRAFLLELHAERVGETFNGVLGSGVDALQRNRALGDGAADVNKRTTSLLQMLDGFERAVDQTPEVRLKKAPHVVDGHLLKPAVHPGARVVNPRIKTAERVLSRSRDRAHVLLFADIGDDVNRPAPTLRNLIGQPLQGVTATCGKHKSRPLLGRHPRRRQADAR
jgi:hypothetical protein